MPQNLTPKKEIARPKFLKALASTGNVSEACRAAGIQRRTYYDWKHGDPEFAADLAIALDESIDALEKVARARAEESSDTLLIFLLKAHRPEKYRDRFTVDMVKRFEDMSDGELTDYLARRLITADASGEDSAGDAAVAARAARSGAGVPGTGSLLPPGAVSEAADLS